MTLREFLAVFTVNDPVAGRALNTTTNGGVDSLGDLLTLSDPSGGRAIKIAISGGVTKFWTEAYNAGTQATSSWTATGAAANINAAIVPKGTGAIVASIPNGTATGGNARGAYAVDLQSARTLEDRVASGSYSVIAGGYNNKVHPQAPWYGIYGFVGGGNANNCYGGYASAIVGGESNRINNDKCFIGGGATNLINANNAVIAGGNTNTVSGDTGTIGGGQSNTASGQHSFVGSGNLNTASGQYSAVVAGQSNSASGAGFVGGGRLNGAADKSGVVSGESNNASAVLSCIGAGLYNTISGGCHYSFIGAGRSNNIGNQYNVICGGDQNTNNGYVGVIGGGLDNRNDATFSTIVGGYQGSTTLYGQVSHGSGSFDSNTRGQAQAHELVWRRAITGTAQTELFLDGASVRAILPGTNAIWHGVMDIAAVCTATGDGTTVVGHVEATSYKVTIKRIGTSTSLVGGVQEIGITNADASMATAVFTIDNDDTNEALRIRFTPPGTAGTTTVIRVVATFRGLQIQY